MRMSCVPEAAIVLSSGSHFEFEKFDRNIGNKLPFFGGNIGEHGNKLILGPFGNGNMGTCSFFPPFLSGLFPCLQPITPTYLHT